jgi:hypothetical protein
MLRFTQIVLAYLLIGAVVWGGGAVAYGNAGPIQYFIAQEDGADLVVASEPSGAIENTGQTITNVISQFGGPVVLLWNFVVQVTGWLNWPLFTLMRANAPPRIIVTLGGGFTAAFWLSLAALIAQRA